MSAPFITTVVDILGIFIYLSIASVLLGIGCQAKGKRLVGVQGIRFTTYLEPGTSYPGP